MCLNTVTLTCTAAPTRASSTCNFYARAVQKLYVWIGLHANAFILIRLLSFTGIFFSNAFWVWQKKMWNWSFTHDVKMKSSIHWKQCTWPQSLIRVRLKHQWQLPVKKKEKSKQKTELLQIYTLLFLNLKGHEKRPISDFWKKADLHIPIFLLITCERSVL